MRWWVAAIGIGMGMAWNGVGAEAPRRVLEVDAGRRDRVECLVTCRLPDVPAGQWELNGNDGETIAMQVDAEGFAAFVLPHLGKGEVQDYDMAPVGTNTDKPAVWVRREGNGIVVGGEHPILRYQAEPGPLPRPEIDSLYRRGGYLHPVFSPAGHVITDDFPPNHIHHHGIWFPWTKTEFKGRHPDFWNMGAGTGSVEFGGLYGFGGGSVFGEIRTRHRFVDLTAIPPEVALLEEWKVVIYRSGTQPQPYHVFDLHSVQRCATDHPLVLPEYRYGGLGFRGRRDWDGAENTFFLPSNGITNRIAGHATRADWCRIYGRVGESKDVLAGITIFGHPDNFRSPQPMRIHPSEPFFCFAPSQLGDWRIEPGNPYVSRYRFVVTDGPPDRQWLDRLWRDYADPPQVTAWTLPGGGG